MCGPDGFARYFETRREQDREYVFCATPPLELLRPLLSRQATRSMDGKQRKTMFIDVKKARLVLECREEVYVEPSEEAEVESDECGNRVHWLCGCRRAGQAWENHCSNVFMSMGFEKGASSPVGSCHPSRVA